MDTPKTDVTMERYYRNCSKVQYPDGFVRYGDVKCSLPRIKHPGQNTPLFSEFQPRADDIYLTGFGKSGTTWLNEAVWLIRNNLDFSTALKLDLRIRVPVLSLGVIESPDGIKLAQRDPTAGGYPTLTQITAMEGPRLLKCHAHLSILPEVMLEKKLIYIARNPKDVCLSKFHFSASFHGYTGTLDEFVDDFLDGSTLCGPYWPHVKEAWERRNESNFLFLTYEDMKQNPQGVLQKIAKFMDVCLTNDQINQLTEHLSFERMKNNSAVNNDDYGKRAVQNLGVKQKGIFMRRGTTGSWKSELPVHLNAKLDSWITGNAIPGLYDE